VQSPLQVANIPRFFELTGLFFSRFPPKSAPLGAKLCRDEKKFPQHFSQKLLISLTLPREAAAAARFNPQFVPCLCRLCAATASAGLSGERFVAEYR